MTDGTRTPRQRALLLAALCLLAAPAAAFAPAAGQKEDVRRPQTINVRPFHDFLLGGKRMLDEGKLSPEVTFDLTVTAELDASGHFKPETIQTSNTSGDATGIVLGAEMLRAVGDSRLLFVLDGAKEVRLSARLDRHAFSASASGEMESEGKASQYVKGYGMLLEVGRVQKRGTILGEFYSGLSLAGEGRRFVIKLELPRATAVRMFREAADKAAAGRN